MTIFSATNLTDIIQVLELPPEEIRIGSDLRYKVKTLEELDTENGTTFVDKVITLLAEYLVLTATVKRLEVTANNNATSIRVDGEYEVTYAEGIGQDSGYRKQRQDIRREISSLLGYTNSISGRVIRA